MKCRGCKHVARENARGGTTAVAMKTLGLEHTCTVRLLQCCTSGHTATRTRERAPSALSPSSMLDLFATLHINERNDLKRKQLYNEVMHILALYKVLFHPVLSPAHCDHALDKTALQINVQSLHFGQVSGSRVKCLDMGCRLVESSKPDQDVCYTVEDGCRRFPCTEVLDRC